MADFFAAIANVGILPIAGAILIVGLFVLAFTHGDKSKDRKNTTQKKSNDEEEEL